MASIPEIVTRYQAAQRSYEKAVARAGNSADAPWTGKAIGIAGRAVAATGNAVQTARLIADAGDKLGPGLTEKLLDAACKAASFAADAAEEAAGLALDLTSMDPLARAGDRTREGSAQIASAISDSLQKAQ